MGTPSKSSSHRTFALVALSLPSSCPATLPSCVAGKVENFSSFFLFLDRNSSGRGSAAAESVQAKPCPRANTANKASKQNFLFPSYPPFICIGAKGRYEAPSSSSFHSFEMSAVSALLGLPGWHPVFPAASVVVSRCVMPNLNKPLCITLAWVGRSVGRFVVGWLVGWLLPGNERRKSAARPSARPTPAVGGWAGSNFLTKR